MALYRESFIVRIACDPPALFWTGVGNLPLATDAVIPSPAIALGAGDLVSIPDFQQLIGGTAERLDFVLSGVSAETQRLALEDAPSVRGARLDIGRIDFGPDWQPLGPVEWEWTGTARELSVGYTDGDPPVLSISLAVGAGETSRSRAPNAYFTDADQRRRSPTDAIFSHVAGINAGTSRRFGPR